MSCMPSRDLFKKSLIHNGKDKGNASNIIVTKTAKRSKVKTITKGIRKDCYELCVYLVQVIEKPRD